MDFELLLSADAARVAEITPAGIRAAAMSGRLPVAARSAGGVRLFRRVDVEQFAHDRRARKVAAHGKEKRGR